MKTVILSLFVVFFVSSFFLAIKILSFLRNTGFPLKGLLKYWTFEKDKFNKDQRKYILLWFFSFTLLITMPWIYMLYYWLNSDYSFFVALYPLLWIYLFNRIIFFEASDYLEEKKEEKKIKK